VHRVARLALVVRLAGPLAAGVLATASPAWAQSTPSPSVQAKDHLRAGLAYAEQGKYQEALRELEEAYALDPQPLTLYNIAQIRSKVGRFRAARDAYTQLVDAQALPPEKRERSRKGLTEANEHIAKMRITVERGRPSDTVTVDGVAVPAAAKSTEVDPGHHVVHLVRDGERIGERSFEVADGADMPVTIAPAPAPAPPRVGPTPTEPTPSDERSGIPPLAIVFGSAAIVAGGLGAFFEIEGIGRWSELRDGCGKTKTCAPGEVDAARRNMLIGDIAIGVGIIAAAAAVYVYIARPHARAAGDHTKASATAFSPFPLGLTHTF
jgi:uncharacterized membrane protein